MRILCDHDVARKYVDAFRAIAWLTVVTGGRTLAPDAPDGVVGRHAESNDWVVFTTDTDFEAVDVAHGVVVYVQREDPPPG